MRCVQGVQAHVQGIKFINPYGTWPVQGVQGVQGYIYAGENFLKHIIARAHVRESELNPAHPAQATNGGALTLHKPPCTPCTPCTNHKRRGLVLIFTISNTINSHIFMKFIDTFTQPAHF